MIVTERENAQDYSNRPTDRPILQKKSQLVRIRDSEALCIELVDVTGKIKGEKREAHEQTNSNHIIDKVGFEGLGKHQNKQQQQQQHLSVCLDQSVPWFNV